MTNCHTRRVRPAENHRSATDQRTYTKRNKKPTHAEMHVSATCRVESRLHQPESGGLPLRCYSAPANRIDGRCFHSCCCRVLPEHVPVAQLSLRVWVADRDRRKRSQCRSRVQRGFSKSPLSVLRFIPTWVSIPFSATAEPLFRVRSLLSWLLRVQRTRA